MSEENYFIPNYGALIERGTVKAKNANDEYTVESIDRPGITTQPLPFLFGRIDKREVRVYDNDDLLSAWQCRTTTAIPVVGDRVYFFMFEDGSGRVICKM